MDHEFSVETTGFGPHYNPVANGVTPLRFSRGALLRAAITVGRTRRDVHRFGRYSRQDMRWRLAALRMGLDLTARPSLFPPTVQPVSRTPLWPRLDPSECSVLNYSLGAVAAKLLAELLLDAPLLLHLDVYRNRLRPFVPKGKRPDFFARTRSGDWLAVEAKGRQRRPSVKARDKAKKQAQALSHVRGSTVIGHLACWVYGSGSVRVLLEDPERNSFDPCKLDVDDEELVLDYYAPVEALLEDVPDPTRDGEERLAYISELDCHVGLHSSIDRALRARSGREVMLVLKSGGEDFGGVRGEPFGRDGIVVVPGESWQESQPK